ncbi:MAG: hypothetical protein K0U60_01600 [Actinomycetia bacterium]|nr:hypothetical protein [Actinomycetes bacterium]
MVSAEPNERQSGRQSGDFELDTFHEYQVWKRARTHDIATGLLACFTIGGVLVTLAFFAWAPTTLPN